MRIQNNWRVHRSNSFVRNEIKWYINICPCLHPGIPGHWYGPSSFFQKPARFLNRHSWSLMSLHCSPKKSNMALTQEAGLQKCNLSFFNNLLFLKVSWFQRQSCFAYLMMSENPLIMNHFPTWRFRNASPPIDPPKPWRPISSSFFSQHMRSRYIHWNACPSHSMCELQIFSATAAPWQFTRNYPNPPSGLLAIN